MAIKLNRNYIGFEISKNYCNIANDRINRFKQSGSQLVLI